MLGPTELLIIAAVIVLLFGASKLPQLGKGLGRGIREFKEETRGLRGSQPSQQGQPAQQMVTREVIREVTATPVTEVPITEVTVTEVSGTPRAAEPQGRR